MRKILAVVSILLFSFVGNVFADDCQWFQEVTGCRYGRCKGVDREPHGPYCVRCCRADNICTAVDCANDLPNVAAPAPVANAVPIVNPSNTATVPTTPIVSLPVNTAVSGPSPQELLVQQHQKEAHDLNEQAVQYYNNKQWKQAADAFKVAMEKNPNDPTIRTNYEHASAALAAETVAKKQESNNTTPNSKAVENPECTRWSRQDNGCDWRMCPGYCEQCCGNTCTRVKCQ